jgi:hypothetical protein
MRFRRWLTIGGLCGVGAGLLLLIPFEVLDSGRGKIPSMQEDAGSFVVWLVANEALAAFVGGMLGLIVGACAGVVHAAIRIGREPK